MRCPACLLAPLLMSTVTFCPAQAEVGGAAPASSKLRSPDDGWFDLSGFIDQAYGFLPVAMPITEPAVGYGAALALAFIEKPKADSGAGFGRPNITVVGGLATENGTRGAFAGDVRHWLGDRVQTQVAVFKASVNLDFYGIGEDGILQRHPLRYTLEPQGGLGQAKVRLGATRAWIGLGYALASTDLAIQAPEQWPRLPGFERTSRVGGLIPSFSYDSRNGIFTPESGTYAEVSLGLYRNSLGGDSDFQRNAATVIQYLPLAPKVTLGLKGDAIFSDGDAPFYMRPFISLRGAQAMRYQGDRAAFGEAELRWQCLGRFSVLAFAGDGTAWNGSGGKGQGEHVVTGGTGFRYELARRYGLHAGLDLAFGPDGSAVYVQFGSAWVRP